MPESKKSNSPHNYTLALVVVMGVFFICGFSTVLNDVLIPYIQQTLELGYTSVILIQTSFYFAYFICSPLVGFLFRHKSYLTGIRWGLASGSVGTFVISYASIELSFDLILLGVFILGAGIAMIQVSANPYALQLGPENTSTSRLSFTHSFTSVGTILAPFFGSVYILSTLNREEIPFTSQFNPYYSPIQMPYLGLSLVWFTLFTLTFFFRLPDGKDKLTKNGPLNKKIPHPLKEPIVLLGMLGIAICVGVEVSVGSFLISFLAKSNIADISMETAGKYTMLFWFGFLLGRIFGSWVMTRISTGKILLYHASSAVICTAGAVYFSGMLSASFILVLGLCTSIMFPSIFSLVLSNTKNRKSEVSGYLCMANIGGAIIPLAQGFLADIIGIQRSFVLAIFCYLFLACFAQYMFSKKLETKIEISPRFSQ
jgi:MFS transporter, FHS family, L-fucose permease